MTSLSVVFATQRVAFIATCCDGADTFWFVHPSFGFLSQILLWQDCIVIKYDGYISYKTFALGAH